MKQVNFLDHRTGREFTRTYHALPLQDLVKIAAEKGLTLEYKPGATVIYENGREVAYCTERGDILHFLDTWANDNLIDLDDPPAWALGQDPDRCEDCGTFLVEDGDSILCPTCDERS